jgi:transposase
MKKVLKRIAGIDVDSQLLVCCFGEMYDDTKQVIISHKTFENNLAGFKKLLAYCNALSKDGVKIRFVFEATGTYHEKLAYYLFDNGQDLSIVLPRKIFNYARTLETKTVTDKTSSGAIMFFALGRDLDNWCKPSPIYKAINKRKNTGN